MDDTDLRVLNTKLEALHADVGEMRMALRELSTAITKLALVEERIIQTSSSLGRAFDAIQKIESRLESLERLGVNTLRTSRWIDRAIWSIAAVALVFIARQVKLL